MKHLIIINPSAGKHKDIIELINKEFQGLDYLIYETKCEGDSTKYLKEYFKNSKELTRVYSCGGDGTLNEVVNGIIGIDNVELALYPIGTGNDFSKIYGTDNLLDFKKLIKGKASPIDITKISGPTLKEPLYSINVVNFGFDSVVGAKGNENKLKGIEDPYGFTHAIIPAILHGRKNKIEIYDDKTKLNEKVLLLGSIAQGNYVGGEYLASPKSNNEDGLLDIIVAKPMTLFTLLSKFFDLYHDGKFFEDQKFVDKKIVYSRSKVARLVAPNDVDVCVDGEMIKGKEFSFECIKGAIKFVKVEKC